MAMEPTQVGKLEIPVEFLVDKKVLQGRFKADVEEAGRQMGRRQAEVQAQAFVQGLEVQYQRRLGEAREELVRGLINPKEFERRGREAAQAMNKGILDELERRGGAGRLGVAYTQDFNVLTGGFKNVGAGAKQGARGIGEMRESFASLLAQAAGVHPVLGRIVNVMGSLAMGSVLMAGVLAGLSALAWWWNKVREDARDAKEEQERGLELLLRIKRERELGPRGETGAAIEGQRMRQEEIARQQEELRQAWREGTRLGDPTALIAQLQEEYDEIEAAIIAGEEQLAEAEREAGKGRLQRYLAGTEPQRRAAAEAEKEAQRAREKAEQEVEKSAERLASLEDDVQKRLAGLTATASDDLLLALDRLEADARAAAEKAGKEVSQGFLDGLAALREDAEATRALEGWQEQLRQIMRLDQGAMQQRALAGFAERMKQEAAALKEGSRARKEYIELANRAADAHKKNADALDKETKALDRRNDEEAERRRAEELRDLRDRARLIEENARAAVQLANAIGLISDDAMMALENLAQLGSAIFRVAGGDLTALPSAIGAAAQLLKGLFGGREESPQARALREAIEQNRRALERNTEALEGRLAGDSPTVAGVRAALEAVEAARDAWQRDADERRGQADPGDPDFEGQPFDFMTALRQALASLGLTMEDVSELAQEFGIDLTTGESAYRQLLDLLARVSPADILNDFAGSIRFLQRQWELLGVTDPAQKMADLVKVIERFASPELAKQLAGVDLTDPKALQAFVSGILKAVEEGTFDLSLLGKLSLNDFLDTLSQLTGLLGAGPGAGTTQDFVQARSTTELTASRIEGALYTENALSSERNALLRQIVGTQMSPSMVASFVPGSISPASYAPSSSGGGASVITLNMHGPLIGQATFQASDGSLISEAQQEAQTRRTGRVLGEEMADAMDRRLGTKMRMKLRAQGRTT